MVQSPVHRPVELTSLFDDLARANQAPTTKLLEFTVGVPAGDVAAELSPPNPTPKWPPSGVCAAPTAGRLQ